MYITGDENHIELNSSASTWTLGDCQIFCPLWKFAIFPTANLCVLSLVFISHEIDQIPVTLSLYSLRKMFVMGKEELSRSHSSGDPMYSIVIPVKDTILYTSELPRDQILNGLATKQNNNYVM